MPILNSASGPDTPCRCFYCQDRFTVGTTVPLRSRDNPAGMPSMQTYRVCHACAEISIPCTRCNFLTLGDRGHHFNGQVYCGDCVHTVAYHCRDCGGTFATPVAGTPEADVVNQYRLCMPCYVEFHRVCVDCGRMIHRNDACSVMTERLRGDGSTEEVQRTPLCRSCRSGYSSSQLSKTFDVNRHKRTVGFEIEFYGNRDDCDTIQNELGLLGEFHSDGSIRPGHGMGLEFASYPSNGDRLFENIKKVCRSLNHNNAGVNSSCGLHIHLHVAQMTNPQRKNLREWWCVFEPLFFAIVSPSRRSNDYARSVVSILNNDYPEPSGGEEDDDYEREERPDWHHDRYTAFNITALGEHGTYEVRLHQGSLNASKIIGWVTLLLEFFETFSNLELTWDRQREVNAMSSRELMIFFFKQMSLPMKMKKYVMARFREFNSKSSSHAPYLILNKRSM